MKMFNCFDIPKSFEPFKGVHDLHDIFELCNDINFAPWEVIALLPQCFTEENFERNIALIEQDWGKHFVECLVSSIRVGSLSDIYKSVDSEGFSHVVENGKFDSHFLEGVRVLKNKFDDEIWDSYDDLSEQR